MTAVTHSCVECEHVGSGSQSVGYSAVSENRRHYPRSLAQEENVQVEGLHDHRQGLYRAREGTQAQLSSQGKIAAYPLALASVLNAGMRDAEIKRLTWAQINIEKEFLIVGRSQTEGGEGRTIPVNSVVLPVLAEYRVW